MFAHRELEEESEMRRGREWDGREAGKERRAYTCTHAQAQIVAQQSEAAQAAQMASMGGGVGGMNAMIAGMCMCVCCC